MISNPSIRKKRIAIVGAAGRLGRLLADTLEKDHEVIRLGRQELDLRSPASITAALEPLEYDLLVIAGALTGVDYCETNPAEAYAVNGEAPGKIAAISATKAAHVTYISTDFVYDGTKTGLYLEADPVNPISVYGASKLEGEEEVMNASAANLVIRISWLFGPGKPAFPEWIINSACAKADLTLPEDKIGCPTSSTDLVELMKPLLFGRNGHGASGIYNLCNSGPCTWREWGQFCIDVAREAGLPVLAGEIAGVPVDSVPAFVARRPVNSAMATEKFTALTGMVPRDWRDAVRGFLADSGLFREFRNAPVSPV